MCTSKSVHILRNITSISRSDFLYHLSKVALLRGYKEMEVDSITAQLPITLARILLYSESMRFHLEEYSLLEDPDGSAHLLVDLDGPEIESHSRRQIASTTRLLEGDDAGNPADKKHLRNVVESTQIIVHRNSKYRFIAVRLTWPDRTLLDRPKRPLGFLATC